MSSIVSHKRRVQRLISSGWLRLSIVLCLLTFSVDLRAQLSIDAGADVQICSGFSSIVGKSFAGGTAPYTFLWSPAMGLSDATNLTPIVTPVQPVTDYIVMITDSKGLVAYDTVRVTSNPRPIADAGPAKKVCIGQSVVLGAAQSARNGTAPYTYEWLYLPSDVVDPASSNPTYAATRTGYSQHVLHVIDAKGCEGWDTVDVVVNQPLAIDVGPGHEGCAFVPQEIGKLGMVLRGTTPPYRFQWSPARGLSSADIPNPLAFPDTTTTYKVTVSDVNGCAVTDSVTVVVKPRMHANLKRLFIICQGKKISLATKSFISGGYGPYKYRWFVPAGQFIDNDTIPDPVATPTGQGRLLFAVQITDARGCELRDTIFVDMTGSPGASFYIQPKLCQNESLPYGVSGDSTFVYTWQVDGGIIENGQGTQNVTIRWMRSGSGRINLSVKDPVSGCSSDGVQTTFVLPLPQPVITNRGKSILCPGSTTTLDAGPGFSRYRWSSGETSQKIIVDKSGVFTVSVQDSNGCRNTSLPVTINVSKAPQPTIRGENKICAGVPIQLHATSGFASYAWNTGERDSVITIVGSGSWKVFVVDSLGCSAESQVFKVDPRPVIVDQGGNPDFIAREIELNYADQEVYFQNTTPEDIIVDSLFLASTNTDIAVSKVTLNAQNILLNSIRGTRVRQNERIRIALTFNPTYIDTNVYKVQIVVAAPCKDTIHIDGTIQSYDKRMWATASVPDIGPIAPNKNISIPLTLQFDSPQDSVEDASLWLDVRVNGYLLDVTGDSKGAIDSVTKTPDSWRIIHMHFDHTTIKYNQPYRLTDIRALTLASLKLVDTMFVDSRSIRWQEGSVKLKVPRVRTLNGLLTVSTYCYPHDVVLSPSLSTLVKVQPNPAAEFLDVQVTAFTDAECQLELFSVEGKKVKETSFKVTSGLNTFQIDLSDLSSGVYPMVIHTPAGREIQQLVITR